MTRDEYVASIKSSFVTLGTKAAMGYLVTQMPFIAEPIMYKLVETLVYEMMTKVVNGGELAIFFQYTDFRVNQQGNAFVQAALKNHQAQLSGTEEEKQRAETELIDRFAEFASLTN